MPFSNEWITKSREAFPELAHRIGVEKELETPYMLWTELCFRFEEEFLQKPSPDEDFLHRCIDLCRWFLAAPRGTTAEDDLYTAVSVCFLEHLPEKAAIRERMPEWFSYADIKSMKPVFLYSVGEDGYSKIVDVYQRKKKILRSPLPVTKNRKR